MSKLPESLEFVATIRRCAPTGVSDLCHLGSPWLFGEHLSLQNRGTSPPPCLVLATQPQHCSDLS